MTVSVNPKNIWRTVLWCGGALFALMVAAIAAAFIAEGCDGVDTGWYDDDKDEFVINTAKELAGLAKLVNRGRWGFYGKTVRLGRDIIINDTANWRDWANKPPARQWVAIGADEYGFHFHGTFDGGGHTVSGVYVKSSKDDQGLFGVISHHGKVKRLNVTASYIEGGNYAGILAGWTAGEISECYTSGIVVGNNVIGGLAGINDGLINNSHAAGSVKGRVNVGGFMGANRAGAAIGNHSSASVSGDSVTGGFVGVNWGGMISGNFSTGEVTGNADAGGFAGRGGVMGNNYYDMETSGQSDSGKGEGKTTAQMRGAELVDSLNTLAGILSINVWTRSDDGYPSLSDKPADPVSMDGYFASGKGTGDDPYIISTRKHLEDFARLVNLGTRFSGKHIKLGQDIALNDTANRQEWAAEPPAYVWMPAGINPVNPFDGTFDGDGHAISGIYVDMPKFHAVGLFSGTSGNATIKNLGITASYIRGHYSAGGLAGHNKGSIINCYSTAIVAAEETRAGGLAGVNSGGTITECYATGAVSGSQVIGGLVGVNTNYGMIRNCYSTGAVSMVGTGKNDHSGGSGSDGVGGLVGLNKRGTINDCYTVSAVKGDSSEYIGPLVGQCYIGTMRHVFFNSETGGVKNNDIGSGRTTEQMKQKRTFTRWNFHTVWVMDSTVNNGYPHLSGRKTAGMSDAIKENTGWYSAQATEFAISTAGELAAFAEIVNGTWGGTPERDDFAGKTVRLTQNIDLAAYDNWEPIGNGEYIINGGYDSFVFSGTFDGGGFVISNLTIDQPDARFNGLFGNIKNAALKNIGLENVNINGGRRVGAVAGGMTGSSSVANCYSTGNVSGDVNVGGLVGYAISGHCFITNSYSTANVSSHSDYVDAFTHNDAGGVAGYMQDYSMIINCYSTGAVSSVGSAGGIMGTGYSIGVRGSAALNPEVKGTGDVNRVITANDMVGTGGLLLSNNAAYAGMEISDSSNRENGKDTASDFRGHDKDGGADLTAHEIHADPTLGGRFKKADGWTTEKGKLPGLFGKAVEMPPHLAVVGEIPAPKAKAADKDTESATFTGSRTRASILRVIETEHRAVLLHQLYRRRLGYQSELRGVVTVRFTIDESGKVTSAKLEKSTIKLEKSTIRYDEFENAVVQRIRHTDFGQADKPGGATEVRLCIRLPSGLWSRTIKMRMTVKI